MFLESLFQFMCSISSMKLISFGNYVCDLVNVYEMVCVTVYEFTYKIINVTTMNVYGSKLEKSLKFLALPVFVNCS